MNLPLRPCSICGKPAARTRRKRSRPHVCSDPECRRAARRKRPTARRCPFCGEIFETGQPKQVTCGKESCQSALTQQRKRIGRVKRECRFCGAPFTTTENSLQTVCDGAECRKALREEHVLNYLARLSEERPDAMLEMQQRNRDSAREWKRRRALVAA